MKETINCIVQAERQAFFDTMHLSGHVRGDEVLPYCSLLRPHEDKSIGFLLRNISESERETLASFDADTLASVEHLTNLPTLQSLSKVVIAKYEGSENQRGGRWTPKPSFREKTTSNFRHNCWPKRYINNA
jgi:hypothetical protein